MKNTITYIIFLALISISTFCYPQCALELLADDLKNHSPEFKTFLSQGNGIEAWEVLNYGAPILRTDLEELKAISSNLDKMQSAGGYTNWQSHKEGYAELIQRIEKLGENKKQFKSFFNNDIANLSNVFIKNPEYVDAWQVLHKVGAEKSIDDLAHVRNYLKNSGKGIDEIVEDITKTNFSVWKITSDKDKTILSNLSIDLTDIKIDELEDYLQVLETKSGANFIDIIIHGEGKKFIIDGNSYTPAQLAEKLANKIEENTSIRLLSCGNKDAAIELAETLKCKIIANDGVTRIHSDGGITTVGDNTHGKANWFEIDENGTESKKFTHIEATNPSGDYKELGIWDKLFGNIKKNDTPKLVDIDYIFDDFYDLSIVKNGIELKPAWKHIDNGCGYRAHLLAEELNNRGIKTKKIFAFRVNVDGGGELSVTSKYSDDVKENAEPIISSQKWQWHVAIIIDNGKYKGKVIDPAIKSNTMTVDEWMKSMKCEKYNKMSDKHQIKDIYSGNRFIQCEPKYLIVDDDHIDINDLFLSKSELDPNQKIIDDINTILSFKDSEKYNILAQKIRHGFENGINVEEYITIFKSYKPEERDKFVKIYRNLMKHLERYIDDDYEKLEDFLY